MALVSFGSTWSIGLKMKILFVCENNLVRSPLAAALTAQKIGTSSSVEVSSAGAFVLGTRPADRRIVSVAAKHGLDISNHKTQTIEELDLSTYKAIVSMDEESFHQLDVMRGERSDPPLYFFSEFKSGLGYSDVPDPLDGQIEWDELYELIEPVCSEIAGRFRLN